jgi:hypothetical protein
MAIRLSRPWIDSGTDVGMDPWQPAAVPMTAAQRTLLKSLCIELKLPFDAALNKQQALQRITELRELHASSRGAAQCAEGEPIAGS